MEKPVDSYKTITGMFEEGELNEKLIIFTVEHIFAWMDVWINRIIGFGTRKISEFQKRIFYIQLKWRRYQ